MERRNLREETCPNRQLAGKRNSNSQYEKLNPQMAQI